MRRLVITLLLLAVALLGGRSALDGEGGVFADAVVKDGSVVRVVDGDTLVVRLDGEDETVRVLGIDTPETKKPQTPVECGGPQASAAMEQLAAGRQVSVTTDPSQDDRDQYGRLLAYVDAGRDLGEALVREGWAEVYVFDDHPFERVSAYRAAARQARKAGRGVQGACGGDFHSAS